MPKSLQSVVTCAKQRRRIPKSTTFEVPLLEVLNQPICNFGTQVMEVKIEARITERRHVLYSLSAAASN
jgi:hypothetical protein